MAVRRGFSAESQIQRMLWLCQCDWSKCEGNAGPRALGTAQVCGLDSSSLSATPADMVAGGRDRWHMLAEGKNSDQLVDVLLEEIGEGLLREKDFFPGLVG